MPSAARLSVMGVEPTMPTTWTVSAHVRPPVAGAPDPDVVHRVAPRGGALGPRAAQPAGGPRRAAPGAARRGAARRRGLARLRRTRGWCFEPGTAGSIGEVLLHDSPPTVQGFRVARDASRPVTESAGGRARAA